MTPAEFLTAVWPTSGVYVLATPYKPAGAPRATFTHKTFVTVPQAADYVARHAAKMDFYFGVHSLKEAKVWNPTKTDPRTGEPGAYEVRTQANSCASKAFFFDIDVGESVPRLPKYPSQRDALAALRDFCKVTGLPKPVVVSSGGGLHVYWVITDELPSGEWRLHAQKLKAIAVSQNFRVDPSRITDSASVLRVAGTSNLKDRQNPRPVQVLLAAPATPTETFLAALDTAVIRTGAAVKQTLSAPPDDGWGSNVEQAYSGPQATVKSVLEVCGIMRDMARAQGNVSEPEWYHTLNLVRFLENSQKLIHRFSEKHPDYDPVATEAKVAQLEAKGIQPTTCLKLAEVTASAACDTCPFQGKVKNPLMAARYRDPAPPPVAVQVIGTTVVETPIPDPPKPFVRTKDGQIAHHTKNKAGDEVDHIILEHDLYPLQRMTASDGKTEQQLWRVALPRSGAKDFALDADALYDKRKFTHTLPNCGVYPHPGNIDALQEYMVSYIKELQRQADAALQHEHLGWTQTLDGFVMPDKVLKRDGTATPAHLSVNATRSAQQVRKAGSLERQVELLRFYEHPRYEAHQFFILSSLASPLLYFTGYHGLIVNAFGEPGVGKSSALAAGGSFWGPPEQFPINGTGDGATPLSRSQRAFTLSNLPVCVDEITQMEAKEAKGLALGISQISGRIRLLRTGTEKVQTEHHKASIMMTTANSSLHGLLSVDNAGGSAGSMRVFEIPFRKPRVHDKFEADDFLHDLKLNYGHIGEAFVAHVVQNFDAVETRVREMVRNVDKAASFKTSERFWSAAVASVLVAGEIAKELGLLNYPVEVIRSWALTKQLPYMRNIVNESYSTPMATLSEFLESIQGNILVVETPDRGDYINIEKQSQRIFNLAAHYDTKAKKMWVLKKSFKDYCTKINASSMRILSELATPRADSTGTVRPIISALNTKKVLGAGTSYAKAQTWCFEIDMSHPEVTGGVDLSVVMSNQGIVRTPPKGDLKPV